MEICVIGTGYVGLVTGACLAEAHKVTCVDVDQSKIDKLNNKQIIIYEPDLEELVKKHHGSSLFFTTNLKDALKNTSVIFLAVGTPSAEDGSADLTYIYDAVDEIIKSDIIDQTILIVKSTVPMGTCDKLQKYINDNCTLEIHVVSNPEFLREGTAVNDFFGADRVVVGMYNEDVFTPVNKIIDEIYNPFYHNDKLVKVSRPSAELIKHASNSFLAVKISYINQIARLCDAIGANIDEVTYGMGLDPRIGSKFLKPGPGYGGSCFPKDTKALAFEARKLNVPVTMVEKAIEANRVAKNKVISDIINEFHRPKKYTLTILGATFKANTDDVRESITLEVVKHLQYYDFDIKLHDPKGIDNFKKEHKNHHHIEFYTDIENEYLWKSDGVIILTEWDEYKNLDFYTYNIKKILDFRNLYDPKMMIKYKNLTYKSIGRK